MTSWKLTLKYKRNFRKSSTVEWAISLAIILAHLSTFSTSCPCRYCGPTTLCHQMNLQEVPYTIPTSEVVRLLLYGNHITVLMAGEFRGMSRLKELDLHENKIRKVESLAFDGLDKLESLHLSNNEIEYLPHGALLSMPKLTRLFLDHNKFTRLPPDVPYLSELNKFNVGRNQIKSILWSSFYTLRKLESVILWDNPLQCDCNTRELITWFLKTPRGLTINTDTMTLRCKEESYNRTCTRSKVTKVSHLPPLNGAQAYISNNEKPSVAVYVQSDDARLHCDVTGNPPPLITWKTPSAGYVYPYTRNRLTSYANGTLVVNDLRTSDTGKYSCHPRQAEGPVPASIEMEIVVVRGVKPEVRATKEKVEGSSSDDVTLKCMVKGNPHPDVQWYSPTNNNTPLTGANFTEVSEEGEFKFRQSNNGTELTIFNLSERDEGLWKCRASNSMGFDAAFIMVGLVQSEDNLILIIIVIACSVLAVVIVAVVIVTCFVTKRRRHRQQGEGGRDRKRKSKGEDKVEEVKNNEYTNPGAALGPDDVITMTSPNQQSLPEIIAQPYTTEPEVKGIRF